MKANNRRPSAGLLSVIVPLFMVLGLESCANSVQILPMQTTELQKVGHIGNGTVYVGIDASRVKGLEPSEMTATSTNLSSSVAQALNPAFKQARAVPDLSRIEPDSTDLIVYVRADNPTFPKLWGDISRGWLRILLVGVLAELYNIASLDFPAYRNTVVLPFAAVTLSLYNFIYCYQYEDTHGSFAINYQVSLIKPDGSVLSRRQITDSAKVLVQADTKIQEFPIRQLMNATAESLTASVLRSVRTDSATINSLGVEMVRKYPADCDRILTYKRNIYRMIDDTTSMVR